MGNYYEILGQMKDGDVAVSEVTSLNITKIGGSFYHSHDGEISDGYGYDGHIINHGYMEEHTWTIKDNWVQIDLNEVAKRLKEGLPVYVDTDKGMISFDSRPSDYFCVDFEDVFNLTTYFKKA